jgi:hypothetical protein
LVGKAERKVPVGRPSTHGRILKLILKKYDGRRMDSFASELVPLVGTWQHGNEASNSIKLWEFLG